MLCVLYLLHLCNWQVHHKILYYVFDSSNNVSQAFLKVIIEEASKEVEPEVKEETPAPPKIENNTPSKNEKEETKPQQNTTIPSQKPSPKYFLFEDGADCPFCGE